ncbi:MAG TPA: hypothetical protein VFB13_13260 [Reyranella sp.]|jgi:hypothetical protein|nr:hypothetical protein [Reyranella sp.]
MTRGTLLAVAAGGLVAAGAPLSAATAQSGDALANAERTCLDYGVRPHTDSYDVCVSRTGAAFDQGAPELAYSEARAVMAARDDCLSMGARPETMGYRRCLNVEIDRHAGRGYAIQYAPDAPHRVVRMDEYGTRYDRDGNVVDQYGYVIHPNPYFSP